MQNTNSTCSGTDECELCIGDKAFTLPGTGESPAKRWCVFCQENLRKTDWRGSSGEQ